MAQVYLTQQGIYQHKAELLDIQERYLPEAKAGSNEHLVQFYEARIKKLRDQLANCIRIETRTPIQTPIADVEQVWIEFWKPLVTDAEGNVDMDQVKKELCDLHFLIQNVGKVYDHITGGMISKVLTDPKVVIREAEDHYRRCYDPEDEGEE
ncbi:hypothetical protein [Tumebacillus permanentifrigoris]|uniref:Uncharacterized protein n=1 Tax=Tumebacillus permanentifrigoris TaxID=378543 RepID=A0A316D911_9BACL|nr:hypothetical protein [Tumebacillus permanentifrigoris]PWK07512.1 hypothetical protein C7459_117111 [Tumebacillus permanentifrigoris]